MWRPLSLSLAALSRRDAFSRPPACTYRTWLPMWAGDGPDERWRDLQVELEPFGSWFDLVSARQTAIAVKHSAADGVEGWLASGERSGRFEFETAG